MSRTPFKIALADKLTLLYSSMSGSAELRADVHEALMEIGDYEEVDERLVDAIKIMINFSVELYHIMNRSEDEFNTMVAFLNPPKKEEFE